MEEKEESSFTVNDRRISSEEGPDKPGADTSKQPEEKAPGTGERREDRASTPLPEVDFASFIVSLATTVQVSLGNVPNPETQATSSNFPAAKQFIDIIAMLKEKTRGNLTEHEQELIENVLFTLRMHYVKVAEGNK